MVAVVPTRTATFTLDVTAVIAALHQGAVGLELEADIAPGGAVGVD